MIRHQEFCQLSRQDKTPLSTRHRPHLLLCAVLRALCVARRAQLLLSAGDRSISPARDGGVFEGDMCRPIVKYRKAGRQMPTGESLRLYVAAMRPFAKLLWTLVIYTNWTCMQQDIHCFMPLNTTVQHLRKFTDTVGIVCDPGFMKRSSVHPSVCPIDPQQQRQPAGLLLSDLPAGYIDR